MKAYLPSLLLFASLAATSPILHLDVDLDYKNGRATVNQKPMISVSKNQDAIPIPFHPSELDNPQEDEVDEHGEFNTAIPSWSTTHLMARRLLAISTTAVLSTVYPEDSRDPSLSGIPIGLPDYFADCAGQDDGDQLTDLLGAGNPLILALNIGTSFCNTEAGSNISLTVDWWDRGSSTDGFNSPAGRPRLALVGSLEKLPVSSMSDVEQQDMERCFLDVHPDAKYWLPDHSDAAHSGYWARLVVEKAFWIGGFGDRARIGWLDMDVWRSLKKTGGDGEKGWDDIKLPGEK